MYMCTEGILRSTRSRHRRGALALHYQNKDNDGGRAAQIQTMVTTADIQRMLTTDNPHEFMMQVGFLRRRVQHTHTHTHTHITRDSPCSVGGREKGVESKPHPFCARPLPLSTPPAPHGPVHIFHLRCPPVLQAAEDAAAAGNISAMPLFECFLLARGVRVLTKHERLARGHGGVTPTHTSEHTTMRNGVAGELDKVSQGGARRSVTFAEACQVIHGRAVDGHDRGSGGGGETGEEGGGGEGEVGGGGGKQEGGVRVGGGREMEEEEEEEGEEAEEDNDDNDDDDDVFDMVGGEGGNGGRGGGGGGKSNRRLSFIPRNAVVDDDDDDDDEEEGDD